jgi:micrococcal nuclease
MYVLKERQMYKYKALVTRVVDGDTFDATVNLGFTVTTKQRFRVKDVDTPETWRPSTNAEKAHGKLATKFVTDLIEGTEVVLTSVKSAVYGRYEAHVELKDGQDLATLLKENDFEKLDNYKD